MLVLQGRRENMSLSFEEETRTVLVMFVFSVHHHLWRERDV
jgi:hypothetical protein